MNERIRELAEQCRIEKYNQYGDLIEFGFDEEKFAELIVRECARVAIAKQTENDIAGIVSKNPAKDFAYALIEHFGVE
jgi:hypothetical protein